MAHVYMLRCSDGSYYVGSTRASLEDRVNEHQSGAFGGYTATRRPVTLVFSEELQWITDAIAAERQLKGWSRAKKEALIRGDFAAIRALARRGKKLASSAVRPSRRIPAQAPGSSSEAVNFSPSTVQIGFVRRRRA